MIHLTPHQLSTYLDGELPRSSEELVRYHLESCTECVVRLTAFREQEAILDRILVHDPGEAFFATFGDEVVGAASTETRPIAKPRREERIVEGRIAEERRAKDGARPKGAAPGPQPAIPWFAALILCVVVGSAAYMMPRPAPAPTRVIPSQPTPERKAANPAPSVTREAPSPVPSIEREAPSPALSVERVAANPAPAVTAREGPLLETDTPRASGPSVIEPHPSSPLRAEPSTIPTRRFVTTTEAAPREARREPPPTPDEFTGAPDTALLLVAAARSAARMAAADSTAANLQTTAEAWDRAAAVLEGNLKTIAREKVAEARYRAWAAAPDPYRAADATAALRTYLVFAPPGPDRDRTKACLSRVQGR